MLHLASACLVGVAGRLAACLRDLRAPERIRHGVAEMLRFRLLMIAAAYEDGGGV
jgi:hypothetical protein